MCFIPDQPSDSVLPGICQTNNFKILNVADLNCLERHHCIHTHMGAV